MFDFAGNRAIHHVPDQVEPAARQQRGGGVSRPGRHRAEEGKYGVSARHRAEEDQVWGVPQDDGGKWGQ